MKMNLKQHDMRPLDILIKLGKMGALNRQVTIKTSSFAGDIGVSQQSISRWLLKLDEDGIIERKGGIRGYIVKITPEGKDVLSAIKNQLSDILAGSGKIVMRGKLVSGMLDGKYYLGLKGYKEGIREKMGFVPFPGTLNVKLNTIDDTDCKEMLCGMEGARVPGFREGQRVFGSLVCFHCTVNGTKGAVIIPERSHHGFDILEVVSPMDLRKKHHLSDGDKLVVEVEAV